MVMLSIWVSGCTTTYTIYVNGFSELEKPIKDKASIYVASDANCTNPIFDKEIRVKVETLLKWYGYEAVTSSEAADYRLCFRAGTDSHKESSFRPPYHPGAEFYGGFPEYNRFGYTTYAPYWDMLYDHWLVMKVFAGKQGGTSDKDKPVWIGEAVTSTEVGDLREAVNYLLVGSFEYFGVDTKKRETITIKEDDTRIRQLTEQR